MICGPASGVGPADPRAGVDTVLSHAGQVPGALAARHALGPALHIRVANIVAHTATGRRPRPLPALCVGAAGRGVAGLHWGRPGRGCRKHSGCRVTKDNKKLTGSGLTVNEGVSCVTGDADTEGDMVPNPALCVVSTEARAGVHTDLILACAVCGAVPVNLALWPTGRWGSHHAWQAGALAPLPHCPRLLGEGATRVGITGVSS